MTKNVLAGLLAALALTAATADRAEAQSLPLSVEARLDAGFPLGDFGDVANTGVGFGIGAAFDLSPRFAVYGEYSKFSFDTEISDDIDIEDDGWAVGGKAYLGTGGGIYNPFVQVGALFRDGDTGLEAGLGANYPLGNNLSLVPSARYRTIDGDAYVTVGLGASLHL